MKYIGFMKVTHESLYLDMQNLCGYILQNLYTTALKRTFCAMIHVHYKMVEK
jgi:hypothetical protein